MKKILYIDNLLDFSRLPEISEVEASAEQVLKSSGGNFGNLAYVYGARRILKNPLTRVDWNLGYDYLRDKYDVLVMSCANQIGSHTDLGKLADHLDKLGLPVVLLSIGVQADDRQETPILSQGTKRFLNVVNRLKSAQTPNISTRGDFSSKILNEMGIESVSVGCPSLFINSKRNLGERIVERSGRSVEKPKVVALGGNPLSQHNVFEGKLKKIVDSFDGEYIVQHPLHLVQACMGEWNEITERAIETLMEIYGFASSNEMFDWFRKKTIYFTDVVPWMREYKKFDIAVGPRYHGIALACQSELPGTVLTIDSRTDELSEKTGIKKISISNVENISTDEVIDMCSWNEEDGKRFDFKRLDNAKIFFKFIVDNGLLVSDHFDKLNNPR